MVSLSPRCLPITLQTSISPSQRWFGLFRRDSVHADDADDTRFSTFGECYACTQVGVPAFHSTSCDKAHQPEWRPRRFFLLPIKKPPRTQEPNLLSLPRVGPPEQARAEVEPGAIARAWDGVGRRPTVLLRAVDRPRRLAVLVHGRLAGGGGDGASHLLGRRAPVPYVAAVPAGVRVERVAGRGVRETRVWDARAIAAHYLRSVKGFWFDAFVILPIPQAVFWLVVPRLLKEEQIKLIMTILLLIFLFQFLPKVYHSICLMRRMQKVTGYIFGTIWWGFGLNLIAYFIASHVAGGCWYVLAINRVASCLKQQCARSGTCNLSLSCSEEPLCLDVNGPFRYGIYKWALPVVSSNSVAVKILYPIFWGLMTLSTFGNDLEPTSHWLEVMFSICTVLSGLMLFTLLIGNIQVFLHSVMARKRKMQLRCRDMEWWMRRRQLPSQLRQRVRRYERQRWAVMGGDNEMELIQDLPELRRDLNAFLCLDLIKKVPLFHSLDDLILDNICDRLKPLVFSKDEKIIREGDPVPRIIFIMRGSVKSSQNLSRGIVATSILKPGGFFGDELLSWCLRRPFIDRLPASSATFTCIESTEAFALYANDLRYITDHFRYKFANERLRRTARYYSSNWRTWAAVNIQLAWRRYILRTRRAVSFHSANGDSDRPSAICCVLYVNSTS
ncbi:UNVERIFIED_CONTAM: Cyclic nucleotide-gated ion channel 2 [Sesamum angustifolium]|uniref:Cyclic nucleotide-gated ion channel 2 n=1 Tax=Sesamum angustifolium TaxID=2727405 RepID=A0AAW2RLZ3_9LAMI